MRWAVSGVAWLAAGFALAVSSPVPITFPEYNGQALTSGFPQASVTVGTSTVSIPAGERIVSATVSGYWGTIDYPYSTAPVNVFLNGILVAQCLPADPCVDDDPSGQRAWSRTLTEAERLQLSDGSMTLTAVQTGQTRIRLGATTLVIQTAAPPAVPTLAPSGLLALLIVMAAAGVIAARRSRRG